MKKLSVFILGCLLSCGLLAAELPKPLVELPLNEGDFAQVKNHGTATVRVRVIHPEQMKWIDGPNGKVLEFKSALSGKANRGYVDFALPQGFSFEKPFTISLLLKTDKNLQRKSTSAIFRFADGFFKAPGVSLLLTYNMLMFRTGVKGTHSDAATNDKTTPILADTWYRYAAVYDGKEVTVYLNGKAVAKKSAKVAQPTAWKYFLLGSGGSGTSYGFVGVVSQFKLFDKALSPVEIAELQKP